MNPMLIEYLVFFAAVFLLIWAAMALNKRLYRHQNTPDMKLFKNWVELDTKRPEAREDQEQPQSIDEEESEDKAKLYIRAHQNGHHVEKPPL